MRPRGEVRLALGMAAAQIGGDGVTWRDLAHQACVGFEVARRTVVDMARAGELIAIGDTRVPGVNRPMTLYAVPAAEDASGGAELDHVVRCWADFR